MRKLIIEDDEGGTSIVPLGETSVVLGRLEESTICLNERNISRRHAIIRFVDGEMILETIVRPELPESMRETVVWVNGKRISGQVSIVEGDVIRLGDFRISVSVDTVAPVDMRPTVRFPSTPAQTSPPAAQPPPPDFGSAQTLRQEFLTLRQEDAIYRGRLPDYMMPENIEPPTIEEVTTMRFHRRRRLLLLSAIVVALLLALILVVRSGCSPAKPARSDAHEPERAEVLTSGAVTKSVGTATLRGLNFGIFARWIFHW